MNAAVMNIVRVLLHGFVLLLANLVGIFVGFLAYHFLEPANQITIQLPVAVAVSVFLFFSWVWLLRTLRFERICLGSSYEFVFTLLCSLVWNPICFVPLHYLTQGYLTNAGNVVAAWLFQIPVNLLTLLVTKIIWPHVNTSRDAGNVARPDVR